ncbi:hypothetical protein GOL99_12200 [Sinorhizobium medicae]|nr:hypothetical protein [Sinorhizobium medicae]
MTCIVGIVHEGEIFMGGDSAGVGGMSITNRVDEKVFRNGPYLIGYTSSFRMGQLLRYHLKVAKRDPDVSAMEHMVTAFIPAVRQCFFEGGYTWKSEDMEFLVGYEGHLFHIENDFQVGEARTGYDACGCGADIALGALHAMRWSNFSLGKVHPQNQIEMALAAAAEFSAGVRGPWTVMTSKAGAA